MRVGFVTCVQLGLSCMEEIYEAGGHLDLAVTLADDLAKTKSGRVYLDDFCRRRGVPLARITHINAPDAIETVRAASLDWLFVIGWSQIAGPAMLAAPRRGVLGAHPTLLPKGRGRAAVPWAILKDLPETGVTLFQLDQGVDTGPILAQERIGLDPDETATRLYGRVNDAHRSLIRRIWPDLVSDRLTLQPQDEAAATYWPARTPADGQLLPTMSVHEAERLVRATTRPYPGAFWIQDAATTLRVWSARMVEPGGPAAPTVRRLAFRGGELEVTEGALESPAPPAAQRW